MNLSVLLKDMGLVALRLPGAAKGSHRFGAAVEPLICCEYQIRLTTRQYFLSEVEIQNDFWQLRQRPQALFRALSWAKRITDKLLPSIPCNPLLTLLYRSLELLAAGLDPEWVSARFYWRWLDQWGLNPGWTSHHLPFVVSLAEEMLAFFCQSMPNQAPRGNGKVVRLELEKLVDLQI